MRSRGHNDWDQVEEMVQGEGLLVLHGKAMMPTCDTSKTKRSTPHRQMEQRATRCQKENARRAAELRKAHSGKLG